MTSKIVVNNIESDTGVSTVTFNSNISVSTATITNVNATRISGVSTAGITTVYTNSFNGGQLGGSRNMIINGSMVVNQRGFTGAAGTTTGYSIDRFILDFSHDGAVSAGQTTMNSTVGGAAYANGFQNALFFKVTTADATLGATQYQYITQQRIEGYNVQGIKKGTANAQPVTLSFWCRSTTIGTYIVELYDNDNTRQCSQAYTINAANTWEKKTLTYPADTTGVFDNDNALSLYVLFWAAAGSNYSNGTLNTSWAANTDANRAAGQVNLLATAGNDFFLTGVQLEVGDRATEFERRSYSQELSLCRRYFTRIYDPPMRGVGTGATNGGASRLCLFFPQSMRVPPTLTITGTFNFWNGSSTATGGTVAGYFQGGFDGIDLDITTSGSFTIGQAVCAYCTNNTTNKYVDLNSEL